MNQYTNATSTVPPRMFPIVTSTRFPTAPDTDRGAALPAANAMPIGRKYMLTTECSKPQATKALMGKTIARTLSATPRAPMQSHTARHTSTLHKIPRATADTGSSATLPRAIWIIVSPHSSVSERLHARQPRESGGAERAEEIAEVYPEPIPDDLIRPDTADGPGHRNEVVTGKQLRPAHHHQHEPQAERDAPGEVCEPERRRRDLASDSDGHRIEERAQRDAGARPGSHRDHRRHG